MVKGGGVGQGAAEWGMGDGGEMGDALQPHRLKCLTSKRSRC